METEWQVETAYASPGKFKRFAGKHQREYDSIFANLEKVMGLLRSGYKLGTFKFGFFRSEGNGIYRVGQSGVQKRQRKSPVYLP